MARSSNFNDYEMLRIDGSARRIEVSFIEFRKPSTGLDEPAVLPLAPALANAIFTATGVRTRKTPIPPDQGPVLAARSAFRSS
ncbi:MAG: hypothetical protein KBC34_14585 [Phenylobacterium sp.]|nr:hypothetical protein [Phenylobacterium sp.]